MADLQSELRDVREELGRIEQQIENLMDIQQRLLDRKNRLESEIQQQEAASTSSQSTCGDWDKADFSWSQQLEDLKRRVFRIDTFRPLQLRTMNCTLSGKDCILIMPTGGGKSLCFQLPALVSKGFTLVVSPLVSLMEDQLLALRRYNVEACLLNASSSKADVNTVQAAMTDKSSSMKLLYCTPEKLAKSKRFMNKLEKTFAMQRLSRIVIDEVHCCSQWGHDFRPDYKFLGVLRRQFPGVPILGLTATATNTVVQDVQKILNIQNCAVFRASFNRENLYYEVRPKPSKAQDAVDGMAQVIKTRFKGQSGIVYCFSRKDSEDVTMELQRRGIKCGCYHADINAKQKSRLHEQWIANEIQVVVATIAFGMGIDKPDVRFVIHHSISKSMENYYQESGRAGRDGAPATCLLYAGFGDTFRQSTMVFTEQTGLEKLYHMVAYAFNPSKCRRVLIARHFGEKFSATQCNEMCDHCKHSGATVTKNVVGYGRDVVTLLEHAHSTQQRVTGLKVLDAWMGKGPTSLRLSSVKVPPLSRRECECVLLHLLTKEILREDFHFTAYSTISYLVPGQRAHLLQNSSCKPIELEFQAATKGATPLVKSATTPVSGTKPKASSLSKSSSQGNKSRPKLSIVNPENSAFMPEEFRVRGGKSVTSDTMAGGGEKKNYVPEIVHVATKRKKKAPVIESDTDSDLDFGEEEETIRVKRRRASAGQECIILGNESDSDFEIPKSGRRRFQFKKRETVPDDSPSWGKQNGVVADESDGDL